MESFNFDVGSLAPTGKAPTVGDIVGIIDSGVSPTDYKAMTSALQKSGFDPLWAYSPVVGDIYTNHQGGTYKPASSSQASSTTTQAPAGTAGQATQSWLGEMPGVPNALRERESWLNDRFGEYTGAHTSANNQYQGVLDSLTSRLKNPNSQVSFGMEGSDQVSFVPRQTMNEMSTLESLANATRNNQMRVPTEQWAWNQTNPIHTADMQIFDLMQQLANQEENRRYGIPTQVNTANYTQSKPDILTLLGAAGTLTNTGLDIYDKGQGLGFWGQ